VRGVPGEYHTCPTFGPGEIFAMAAGCEHTEWFGPEGATYLVGRKHRAA
jgi:hypothetical protein